MMVKFVILLNKMNILQYHLDITQQKRDFGDPAM
jgi:hypothetical protein